MVTLSVFPDLLALIVSNTCSYAQGGDTALIISCWLNFPDMAKVNQFFINTNLSDLMAHAMFRFICVFLLLEFLFLLYYLGVISS